MRISRTRYVLAAALTFSVISPCAGRTLDLRVFERDGKVMTQAEGQPEIPLRHQGNGVFGADFDRSLRLTFAPGAPSPKVTLVQGGATIDGPRVQ